MPCLNSLNDNVFNRCMIEDTQTGFWTGLGESISSWVNPRLFAVCVVFFAVALPQLTLGSNDSRLSTCTRRNIRSWGFSHLKTIHFLHRISFCLTLDCALYAVFRQHRPCICDGVQVGSIYGMPSGDAMTGAVVGMLLIMEAPYHKNFSRAAGALVIFLKCAERLALGAHSLGQVTSGATIGIALSLYSMNAPMYMLFFDNFFQVLMGLIAIPLDPALDYKKGDHNNILAWFLYGVAFCIFTTMCWARFFYLRNWEGIKETLPGYINARSNIGDTGTDGGMGQSESETGLLSTFNDAVITPGRGGQDCGVNVDCNKTTDVYFTILATVCCAVAVLISYYFEQYAWGYE
eukprot:GFYU01000673.1.p1 GENE.GFYU01000673.1~~GFYU01000673.1.p1  ORF type:complete len:348 (-),score=81.58 GFYU01000673.1:64-1107(-)